MTWGFFYALKESFRFTRSREIPLVDSIPGDIESKELENGIPKMAQTNKLSSKQIEAAKPRESDYTLFDGGGLYVLVKTTGVKLWRQKYSLAGKPGLLAHGEFGTPPKISLVAARVLRDAALIEIANGKKPLSKKQQARAVVQEVAKAEAEAIEAEATTFEAIAREWIASKSESLKPITFKKITLILEQSVLPDLGRLQIAKITGAQVGAMLKKIEARGALEIAKRAQQYTSNIFKLAMKDDRAPKDCAAPYKGETKQRPVRNNPTIKPDGLVELLRAIRGYQGEIMVRLALEFVLQTAARTAEVIGALWAEFDLARAVWTIPAERMKMGKPHTVPLTARTLEILAEAKQHCGASELVFPGRKGKLSSNTLLFALYRLGYHTRASVHGFRSLFSTVMNELDRRHDVIERALAHGDPDAIRGTYNKATYQNERRVVASEWSLILELSARGVTWDTIRTAVEAGQTLESLSDLKP